MPKGQYDRKPRGSYVTKAEREAPVPMKKYVRIKELRTLPKIDYHDPKAVHKRVGQFLTICEEQGIVPTMIGLAVALGCSRRILSSWLSGERKTDKAIVEDIQFVQTVTNAVLEEGMLTGELQPVSSIFLLKNNYGYSDEQKITLQAGEGSKGREELLAEAEIIPDD